MLSGHNTANKCNCRCLYFKIYDSNNPNLQSVMVNVAIRDTSKKKTTSRLMVLCIFEEGSRCSSSLFRSNLLLVDQGHMLLLFIYLLIIFTLMIFYTFHSWKRLWWKDNVELVFTMEHRSNSRTISSPPPHSFLERLVSGTGGHGSPPCCRALCRHCGVPCMDGWRAVSIRDREWA